MKCKFDVEKMWDPSKHMRVHIGIDKKKSKRIGSWHSIYWTVSFRELVEQNEWENGTQKGKKTENGFVLVVCGDKEFASYSTIAVCEI